MLYSIVGILVVILDQAVKFWVQNTLFGSDIVKFIPGVVSLVNVHNSGAAFGILSGANARIYFIIVTGVFCLLVVLALATNFVTGRLARWSLVMVAAGGIGNLIDRILYGYVQDMFKVELFNFAIFNVADIFITVFAILFALCMIFEKPEEDFDDELYEDDVEEDEDDEDVPARKPLFGKMKEKRQSARSAAKKSRQEKYEREYEEYRAQQLEAMHMDPSPRKSAPAAEPAAEAPAKPVRKQRRAAAEEMPAKAQRRAAVQSAEAPARRPAAQSAEDPFAAWEKASAKHEGSREANYAEKAMGTSAPRSAAKPQRPVVQAPVEAAPAAAAPAAKPVVEAPKPQPKAKPVDDDFNLDDILAEFK